MPDAAAGAAAAQSLPATHDAVWITAPGGPQVLQLRTSPIPLPCGDEVLIKVAAAGVNRHDVNQRRRGPTTVHSNIPGLEVAGRIVAVGRPDLSHRLGQDVCALTDGGGYAQHVVAPSALALPVPAGLTLERAACLPEAAFTVWHNFFQLAALGPGESVLIHGGTSGVGSLAIPLLTGLGHPVLASCGTPEKVDAAQRLGARLAFDYRRSDWAELVLAATAGRGVDVILDMSAGRHTASDMLVLAQRGRLLHLSPGQDQTLSLPLKTLMAKEIRVTGSLLRPLPLAEKALIARRLEQVVWPLVSAGRVVPTVAHTFTLHAAAAAHEALEHAGHVGKIVLRVAG